MRWVTNFYLIAAFTWLGTLVLYVLRWSDLNASLDPRLLAFLSFLIVALLVMGAFEHLKPAPTRAGDHAAVPRESSTWRRWRGTLAIALGFALDFAYQDRVPLLAGGYEGYDVSAIEQRTVGIPVVHVILVSTAIFYAILLVDRFIVTADRSYLWQHLVVQAVLLLNYSRGYMVFAAAGALLLLLADGRLRPARRTEGSGTGGSRTPQRLLLGLIGTYGIIFGIGVFGNLRSGSAWDDSSYISRIGRFNDSFPSVLSDQLKWTYTYVTSPLANLNHNITWSDPEGSPLGALANLVPETFDLGPVGPRPNQYLVEYLNASTGYVSSFYDGGGVAGLYVVLLGQVAIVAAGAAYVRSRGTGYHLYAACASIVLVALNFFNTFSTSATSYMLLFAVFVAHHRARQRRRSPEEGLGATRPPGTAVIGSNSRPRR